MKTFLFAVLAIGAFVAAIFGISFKKVPELERIFKDRGVSGTFVMFDAKADTMFVWNEERAKQRFAPAATFRIANALVGLDVGAVKSIDEVVPYQAKQYTTYENVRPYIYGGGLERANEWNRQMELRKAMRIPNTPIFRELARRIGIERMRDGMAKLAYGNMEVGNEVDRFWRDGTLQISAIEQAEFLARLAQGKLPVAREVLKGVRELTLKEKTAIYRLHSKTGSLITTNPEVGWWVGWIERENEVFSFALNIEINSRHAEESVLIGRECLKALGKL